MTLIPTAPAFRLQFFPSVVSTLGYDRTRTYLLTAPPFLLCVVCIMINGYFSDKRGDRFWHVVGPLGVTMVANVIAVASLNTAARYVSPNPHVGPQVTTSGSLLTLRSPPVPASLR